jgi:phosphonate transport system permease protein
MTATAERAGDATGPGGISARPRRPHTAWKGWLIAAVVVAITYVTGAAIGVNIADLVENWRHGAANFVQLLQPDYWFFPQTLKALSETIEMAVIATFIASVISLPISFAASRVTNPRTGFMLAVRAVMNIVRAVPDLLYAAILVAVVGTGALSGMMALVLFNLGILVKLVSEALDAVDRGPQEAALASGAGWVKADRAGVLPEALPAYASQVLYTLELNIRASTVLGLVGAGGLGMLIDQVRTFYHYHALSLIILEILVIVLVLEALSSYLRRKLVS